MRTICIFLFLAVTLPLCLFGQDPSTGKEVQDREMTWLAYFNQTRFTKRSGLWFDGHMRLSDSEIHTMIGRAGYIYYFSDNARFSTGYAYISQPGHNGAADAKEHRPWQQIQWFDKRSWFSMSQYIRLEQRFRKVGDSDYDFLSHRVRLNFSMTIPLTKKEVAPKTPFIFLSDELFVNAGKNIVYNYFDQNRLFIGVGYQFTPKLNAHLGYLNVFQQSALGNTFVNTDAFRLFVFHNLDFRAKD
jgi:hypothetical protein